MKLNSIFLEEVLQVKSGTYSIPWAEGEEEGYINITFSIPKGERGGDGYDGHSEAENYLIECEQKKRKKADLFRLYGQWNAEAERCFCSLP